MTKRILFCLVIAFSLVPFLAVFTTAQDFQKTYSLGSFTRPTINC